MEISGRVRRRLSWYGERREDMGTGGMVRRVQEGNVEQWKTMGNCGKM